jgi:alkylation response protein AidB-like acyl-CoA dehydrogenase
MDLELTDEQRWLSESVDTLLDREWTPLGTADERRRVWQELVTFGALAVGEEIGAVEACLIARALGTHLASVPFTGSAAARLAFNPPDPDAALAVAILEPGSSWAPGVPATVLENQALSGEKMEVEQLDLCDQLVVSAAVEGGPALVIVAADDPGLVVEPRPSFDPSLPTFAARFDEARATAIVTGPAVARLTSAAALLCAAEATGAAQRILDEARRYAAERRQFGRTIGSFQALRHILADMYVRAESGFSAVLYAAAAFDEGADEAAQAASVAKAYVARGAREVAHGAMQVFGGIAFTAEHPAHRFLRRIVVRERQFGDAAHHERALGRPLAEAATDLGATHVAATDVAATNRAPR